MLSLLTHLALAQSVTSGETPALDAQHFRPSIDGRHTLWTDDAARGEHERLFLRPLFHYTRQPLVYVYEDGDHVGLLNDVLQGDLMAGFAYDRVRVGLDLPVYFFADGEGLPSQSGIGDLDVDAKVTLVEPTDGPRLAVSGRLSLPTSTVVDTLPLGNGAPGWELAAIADHRIGKLFLAGNVGLRGSRAVQLENVDLNDFLLFRLAGAWLLDDTSGVALEVAGDVPFTANTLDGMPVEALLSGYTDVAPDLKMRGGVGTSISQGIAAPDYRVILGFEWRPQPDRDADDDGIEDDVDACPAQAEDLDGEQDEDGCPEALGSVLFELVDPSGDPLTEAVGRVGEQEIGHGASLTLPAGSVTLLASAPGFQDTELQLEVADEDVERKVRVELQPVPMGTLSVSIEDIDGNPLPGAVLRIGEEEHAGAELTVAVPADAKVPLKVRAEGYLSPPKQYVQLESGVTEQRVITLEKARAQLSGDRIELRESVFFDVGAASIQDRSHALLDQVVDILEAHPEVSGLRIEGHTDSRGAARANKELSQARAESVKAYLVERGIAAERLVAEGFGEEKPLDPAENEEAWAKNRRVDFLVSDRAE